MYEPKGKQISSVQRLYALGKAYGSQEVKVRTIHDLHVRKMKLSMRNWWCLQAVATIFFDSLLAERSLAL